MPFRPPAGHPESSGSGGLGRGEELAGQRSTTAKRQRYWPESRLHSPTFEVWRHSMSSGYQAAYSAFFFFFFFSLNLNRGATCGAKLSQPALRQSSQIKQVRAGHLTVQFHREKALNDMKPVICSVV